MKRMLSFLMAVAMVLSILPMPALAAEGCANHPAHDASCGYVAAVEGQPCTHQHSDACWVETTVCTHVHTAECYPEGNMEGEPALCGHVCSEESGCVTVSCNHVHNEECGYVEAVEGKPCGHACELCNPPEKPEEVPVCICDTRCNEMVNTDCPVCAVDASQCAVPQAHEIPQAVLDVQAMIDALPSLEKVKAMADKGDAYNQTQAAYEAYEKLTQEEKALVTGTEVFEVLFTYFNSLAVPAADITYLDENGDEQTLTESYTSVSDQTSVWNSGWYVVDSDVTITGDVTLNGTVNLILLDEYTLNVTEEVKLNGNSLTICGQSAQSGVLIAQRAGDIDSFGDITINSGFVQTTDGSIGNGRGTTIINGGKVTANGGYQWWFHRLKRRFKFKSNRG